MRISRRQDIIPSSSVSNKIHLIRETRVMLGANLAIPANCLVQVEGHHSVQNRDVGVKHDASVANKVYFGGDDGAGQRVLRLFIHQLSIVLLIQKSTAQMRIGMMM